MIKTDTFAGMTRTNLEVRPIIADDRDAWEPLFRAYRDFYRSADSDEVVDTVWGWLLDPNHETNGLVALESTTIVGFAHYRSFARPTTGTTGLWLDDLFTAGDQRGQGIGRALIGALTDKARDNNMSVLRWITAADNQPAQRLYDSVADRTSWLTYDATP